RPTWRSGGVVRRRAQSRSRGGGSTASRRLRAGATWRQPEKPVSCPSPVLPQLVPIECSSLVAYRAVHQGSRDALGGAAEHDGGRRVLPGEEGRALQRDDGEVGALARLQRSDLVV